jgi:predicted nucleic acid-binding protein
VKRTVLDASAVISFFEDPTGAEEVEKLVADGVAGKTELFMSVVNWGEVYYSAWRARGQHAAKQVAAEIFQFPIQIVAADFELTKFAAELHAKHNLPYADCFAAALTKMRSAQLVTADRDFAKIKSEIEILFL